MSHPLYSKLAASYLRVPMKLSNRVQVAATVRSDVRRMSEFALQTCTKAA